MKTLPEQVLLYDKDCPLCAAYSSAFISFNMLDKNGRVNYGDTPEELQQYTDMNRARNQIALLNKSTGEVSYGLNSLLLLIGNRFPMLSRIGRLPFVYQFFSLLYAFISYNRRVIIPRSKQTNSILICDPDLHIPFRVAFIVCMTIASSYILYLYFNKLGMYRDLYNSISALMISAGQLLWMSVVVLCIDRKKLLDYLGNNVTLSFAGALLLLIPILLHNYISEYLYCVLLLPIITWMSFEHIRRLKLLKLSPYIILLWLGYGIVLSGLYIASL